MALAREYQLFQASLEIQYDRGVVYLDRCGSLMLRLQDALGAPRFDGNVPAMQFAELRNDAERIVMQYGPSRFAITQTWMPSPARFEQLAPLAWETVATALEVSNQVTRLGVRFLLLWKVDSLAEGLASVERSGLGKCDALFGKTSPMSFNAAVRDRSGDLRLILDAVGTNVQEELLPKDLVAIVPRYAVQLDMDHAHPSSTDLRTAKADRVPFAVTRAQTKDFLRASWQRTRDLATKTRALLGEPHGE